MSKAFTKENDQAEGAAPIIDDSSLPAGEPNYITMAGLEKLRADIEAARALAVGPGRALHEPRVLSLMRQLDRATVVDPQTQPHDRVLFGAQVTVAGSGPPRTYRIVGVFEADARRGLISWRSPLARALVGQKVGAVLDVKTPVGPETLEIIAIEFPPR